MSNKKQLKKGAFFTDIHFGKKGNSSEHNQDCINFITWFCDNVKSDPTIDYIAFLGDWNENRSALNIHTLKYSYEGAKLLNDLGLPVYFVIGNHDLYHRHSREIHSVIPFTEFDHFIIIDTPTIVNEIENTALFCPFMFAPEYETLTQYFNIPFWAGHFEFKDFVVTGYNILMQHGPDATSFLNGPKHIVSGHYHKRQIKDNVVYMGNCFPMDFGDASDINRGMMIFDHSLSEMNFLNWEDCPKYIKTNYSDIKNKKAIIYPNSRVKCLMDQPVTYEESLKLHEECMTNYNLREFVMEEINLNVDGSIIDDTSVLNSDVDLPENHELSSINELVGRMLSDIKIDNIDNELLIDIYSNIR